MINMKFKLTVAAFFSAALLSGAERSEEIRLWAQGAPGSEGITAAEVSTPSRAAKYSKWPGNFTVTHYPSIYVFLPPKEKATGAAMIVAPGGGHRQLVMEKEGWEVADWLNERGIAAFVLEYRLGCDPALSKIASVVHGADISENTGLTPESAGLKAIASGFRLLWGRDDHRKIELEFPLYDALYRWAQECTGA